MNADFSPGTTAHNLPIIQVRGVTNQFSSHVVHQDLDLDVQRGEILGVVGGSGSGKSVLLRTIVGLHKPATGTVRLFNQDIVHLSAAQRTAVERRFGVLFQRGALFSSLTLLENVALPLIEHIGLSRSQATRIAQLKIALVGLPSRAGLLYPSSLSGGMIKRGLRWPERWLWTRTFCFLTSPLPAWTRSAQARSTSLLSRCAMPWG